jgi:hypothetical protein
MLDKAELESFPLRMEQPSATNAPLDRFEGRQLFAPNVL